MLKLIKKEKMVKYEYIRVSSESQPLNSSLSSQQEELMKYGVLKENIIVELESGKNFEDRLKFQALEQRVQERDSIYVTKLDRFSRNTRDAMNKIHDLKQKKVQLISLEMPVLPDSSYGELITMLAAGLAQLERDRIRERQMEGIRQAKLAGKYKGSQFKIRGGLEDQDEGNGEDEYGRRQGQNLGSGENNVVPNVETQISLAQRQRVFVGDVFEE
jgi:DNA invertase Pin-like site-specific DNA recombinase